MSGVTTYSLSPRTMCTCMGRQDKEQRTMIRPMHWCTYVRVTKLGPNCAHAHRRAAAEGWFVALNFVVTVPSSFFLLHGPRPQKDKRTEARAIKKKELERRSLWEQFPGSFIFSDNKKIEPGIVRYALPQ